MNKIIAIVEAVKATQRISKELHSLTFFGEDDLWLYIPLIDNTTCDDCQAYADREIFSGADLRRTFQWLEIESENRIWANVHPNCRCYLLRVEVVRE